MTAPAVPAGYAIERERGATIVALPSVMQAVLSLIAAAGTLHEAAASRGGESFAGRGTAHRLTIPAGDWLVRHYHRGGLIARVLRDEYVRTGEPRPLRELRASAAARDRGVDTPEVTAAITYPAGPFYRADLATRFIGGSRDLGSVVLGAARADAPARAAAWRACGALLRTAFAAGVDHADLNLRNILIAGEPSSPRALLLDLDRAAVRAGAVGDAARRRMLARLHRSRRKLESAAGQQTNAVELDAFEQGLAGADG